MTFNPETSLGAYDPMLNVALFFLLISVTLMVATFAYKKYCVKESREPKGMDEAKRELIKTEKEREKAIRIEEETGYSERDEHDNDDSDDDGE